MRQHSNIKRPNNDYAADPRTDRTQRSWWGANASRQEPSGWLALQQWESAFPWMRMALA